MPPCCRQHRAFETRVVSLVRMLPYTVHPRVRACAIHELPSTSRRPSSRAFFGRQPYRLKPAENEIEMAVEMCRKACQQLTGMSVDFLYVQAQTCRHASAHPCVRSCKHAYLHPCTCSYLHRPWSFSGIGSSRYKVIPSRMASGTPS